MITVISEIIYQEFKFVTKFEITRRKTISPMNKSFYCINLKKKTAKTKKLRPCPEKVGFRYTDVVKLSLERFILISKKEINLFSSTCEVNFIFLF